MGKLLTQGRDGIGIFADGVVCPRHLVQAALQPSQHIEQAGFFLTMQQAQRQLILFAGLFGGTDDGSLLFKALFFPGFRGDPVDLLLLHLQNVPALQQVGFPGPQLLAAGLHGAQLLQQLVTPAQQVGILQGAFHEPGLEGRLQQLLLSVLAGMGQQLFPQGTHAFLGAQGIINIQAAAAALGQKAAPDDDLPSVHLELCFDLGLFRSLTYHIGAQPVAQQKAQGFEDKAFACPCFAGEHVHARGKVEFGVFDESEIADTQIFQHG